MGFEPVIDSTTCSFMQRAVAQLVSVHVWGAWGRRFKSAQPEFKNLVGKLIGQFAYSLTRFFHRMVTLIGVDL